MFWKKRTGWTKIVNESKMKGVQEEGAGMQDVYRGVAGEKEERNWGTHHF